MAHGAKNGAWGRTIMMARVWTVFTVECQKAAHQRLTWLAPLFILLVACALPTLHPFSADGVSDYDFVLFSVSLLNGTLLMLFTLIYAANLIAPELSGGLARHVFVRPISKGDWLAGKLLFVMSYALLLALLSVAAPWAFATLFGNLLGVSYGGELVHTAEAMRNAYLLGFALSLPPIWAGAAFALLLSTLSRSALSAAGLAIALWVVIDVAKHPLGIEVWVFTTWLEGAWQPFGNMLNTLPADWKPLLTQNLASSALVFFPSIFLAMVLLRRRSLGK